ncbi:MAG: C40 family peptidase [Treponema sp.]|nr:C40 family peptidase [Treponema sp.]
MSLQFIFAKEYSQEDAARLRSEIVKKAKSYIGCPYKTGAIGPDMFDCSGLVFTVFREAAGIQLPRSAKAIYSAVKIVSTDLIEEGDLVFFKTTGDGTISHVGIYIGRNQFIHAASDGSNTGVIASSLTEKYYKNTFAAVGKPLTSAKKNKSAQEQIQNETTGLEDSSSSSASSSSSSSSNSSFVSNLTVDATLSCDWNLWLPNKFMINFRGITLTSFARYTKNLVKPGIGTALRWNYGSDCFQLPVLFSLGFSDYINVFIGPVFTIGTASMPDQKYRINGSIFPGMIGISFNTPNIKAGNVYLSITQDFVYTVFNATDGGALGFAESMNAGFVFSTGIRVTLPLKNVLK